MNRQVKITDATHAELLTFCRETLGLNLPPNTKVSTLEAKLALTWGKDYINIADVDAPGLPAKGSQPLPATAEQHSGPAPGMIRVKLSISEKAGGDEDVQVGVNGSVMLIPRDKEVDIPYKYYEALKHAVAFKYEMLPGGGMNPVPREVPNYPLQVIAGDLTPPVEAAA